MKINNIIGFTIITVVLLTFLGCEKFLEIEPPKSKIVKSTAFEDDLLATQALTGIYSTMFATSSFSSGSNRSIVSVCGMSADELQKYPRGSSSSVDYYQFDENNLISNNAVISSLWTSMYKIIYQANDVIEGLNTSNKVNEDLKKQLLGEAYVIRAFTYFYIVNLFGDAPLPLTTDYMTNSRLPRRTSVEIYSEIIDDLKKAKEMLPENYVSEGRVRPNKSVAKALLARVYLYQNNWSGAESEASEIIENTSLYKIHQNLNDVFLTTSTEAIWQLFPSNNTNSPSANRINSQDGSNFIPFSSVFPPAFNLTSSLINSFELGDKRKTNWIAQQGSVFYPAKYKVRIATTITEYSMLIRLAEIHLIRAEARAKQNKLASSIDDIDIIRNRAGLTLIKNTNPSIDEVSLISAIHTERRNEFFAEWGHRWLDLKRTGKASSVLSPLKIGWSLNDLLYPIPQSEFINNPFLGNQNPGY